VSIDFTEFFKETKEALASMQKSENLVESDPDSLGSWQAIGGASLAVIGKSLGHKSADATMIYARLSIDPVRQSVTSATSAMLTAAGVKNPAEVTPLKRRRRQAAATP